jgi:hypothetical protein
MRHTRTLLKDARQFHLYIGVFTAPAILFFAITGALQIFSFHETTKGSNYKPPKILVELGQLHKKQTFVVPDKKPQPPAPSAGDRPKGDRPRADRLTSDGLASDRPSSNRPASDRPADDKPTRDRQSSEPPTDDKSAVDTQAADKPVRDRSTGDKPSGENSAKPTPSAPSPETKPKNLLPMKIFFLIVALSLVTSTVTGLYMSYKFVRNKTLITTILLIGIAIPVTLAIFFH